jgi:uncharacterized membrane protein YphA (DoxX/SURF4 family)
MSISSKLDQLHARAKNNLWMRYFAIFNRVALAAGFLPSGYTKVIGERFTSLAIKHPMGHYLEALHYTGYYYTFIGILQMTAAVLLLIPRTATLGAVLYFPIILNICILSLAVCFEGSLISSPLMVLSNLFLLCWDYDKLKYILPFKHAAIPPAPVRQVIDKKFPTLFFVGVAATVILVVVVLINAYTLMPRVIISDCQSQCADSADPEACNVFCDCIYVEGRTYDNCLDDYKRTVEQKDKNHEEQ